MLALRIPIIGTLGAMMRIRLLLGLVLLLSVAASAETWSKNYAVSDAPQLMVKTDDGSVMVRGTADKSISVRIDTEGYRIGPHDVRVIEHQTGDIVSIEVKTPNLRWGVLSHHSVRIEVSIPVAAKLDVNTSDGSVKIFGLKGDTRLNTSDGSIEVQGHDGALRANTSDGSIRASGRFDRLELNTSDGRIDCIANNGSRVASDWRIRTSDGSVNLQVPQEISADLDVSTSDGSVTVDFPVMIQGKQARHLLRGKLNAGGNRIVVHTSDGSVRVGKS